MALSKILPASQEQYVGTRNIIINGNFSCWQRSTDSETTSTSWAYRTVDRFQINRGRYRKTSDTVDGRTVDVVQIDPASGVYHGGRGMFTKIEDYNVYDKPTVLSVYVKADAATTAEIGQLYDYGGGSTVQAGTSVNITTDWQRFEVQYSAQTFSQAAGNYIVNALVDGRTYYVAMVQLEEGTQATFFEHENYGDTLLKCQRYHTRIMNASGQNINTTVSVFAGVFPTEMRTTPTGSVGGTITMWQMGIGGSKTQSSTSFSVNSSVNSASSFNAQCSNFPSLTANRATAVSGTTRPFIFDAEL
jgi:hypothetical protein